MHFWDNKGLLYACGRDLQHKLMRFAMEKPMHGLPVQAYRSVSPRVLDIIDEIIGECVNPPDPRYSDSPLDRYLSILARHRIVFSWM